jgi:hypothetical protein
MGFSSACVDNQLLNLCELPPGNHQRSESNSECIGAAEG